MLLLHLVYPDVLEHLEHLDVLVLLVHQQNLVHQQYLLPNLIEYQYYLKLVLILSLIHI